MNQQNFLSENTLGNLKTISREKCEEWGGEWVDGEAHVTKIDSLSTDYTRKTEVRSEKDAIEAFEHYEEYFTHVLDRDTENNEFAVFLPCGSQKPIGSSSVHKKKLNALEASGLLEVADVYIMSEPCVIVPHDERLKVPPTNYDFPPEYTSKEDCPQVFELFVEKLTMFLEEKDYDTIFSYLVEGHQNKMDEAVQNTDVEQVKIPGASYNPETENCSGDYFKSVEDMALKIKATIEIKHESGWLPETTEDKVLEYYQGYLN